MADSDHTNEENIVLDLHNIALLLNYERASTEPRFRHTKLREFSTASHFRPVPRMLPPREWVNATVPRTGLLFQKKLGARRAHQTDEPDLPSNMVPNPVPESLCGLDSKATETLYRQARDHDGCFRTTALFQCFFDLWRDTEDVFFRVRTVENHRPKVFVTPVDGWVIKEMQLLGPKSITMACVQPGNKVYISGGQHTIDHAVLAFQSANDESILDLASLQFGDAGRGAKGRGLFVLEPVEQYVSRLDSFSEGNTSDDHPPSFGINLGGVPDIVWLKRVARKVKQRWENRNQEHWCGHCGAPPLQEALRACSKCHQTYYCDEEHQKAAWPFQNIFALLEGKIEISHTND